MTRLPTKPDCSDVISAHTNQKAKQKRHKTKNKPTGMHRRVRTLAGRAGTPLRLGAICRDTEKQNQLRGAEHRRDEQRRPRGRVKEHRNPPGNPRETAAAHLLTRPTQTYARRLGEIANGRFRVLPGVPVGLVMANSLPTVQRNTAIAPCEAAKLHNTGCD